MRLAPSGTDTTCIIVTAAGSDQVHLAAVEDGGTAQMTLCGRQVQPALPTRHFQEAGCCPCAKASLDRGVACAQETAQVMVNLRRFYDRTTRATVQA